MGSSQSKSVKGGYRILKINEGSPASKCDLEIFFDYIVQIDGIKITDASKKTYENFIKKVKESENKTVVLLVYNCRYNKTKEVKIIPQKWKGNGLLGMNINYELFNALHEGTRIIDILKNSPASNSNLVEQKDFIIGCEESILRSREDILNYVNNKYIEHIKHVENVNNNNINSNNDNDTTTTTTTTTTTKNTICNNDNETDNKLYITFYVYNIDTQKIRKVKLQPNKSWGGEGLLGCNIANGILHKVPLCKSENLVQPVKSLEHFEKSEMHKQTKIYNLNDGKETSNELKEGNSLDLEKEKEAHTCEEAFEKTTPSDDNTYTWENVDIKKTDAIKETTKNVNGISTFENTKERAYNTGIISSGENAALNEMVQNPNEIGSNETKQEKGNSIDSIEYVSNIGNDSEIIKGEKIILDKDHNFVQIKSGYSIILTSEDDVKDMKEKQSKEKSKISEHAKEREEKEKEKEKANGVDGDNYLNYVKLMDMYSKEFEEVCTGMNKNKEILSNLGIVIEDKTIVDACDANGHIDMELVSKQENDEVVLSQEKTMDDETKGEHDFSNDVNKDTKNEQNIGQEKVEGEKREDTPDEKYSPGEQPTENNPLVDNAKIKEANDDDDDDNRKDVIGEKTTEMNTNESTQNIEIEKTNTMDKINETAIDDTSGKNTFSNNDLADLIISDMPKAGIIYPTKNL